MARLTITFEEPSLAVQSAKSECDVHTILKQYRKTGILPNRTDAYYADVTKALGFQDAFNLVIDAQNQFAALPAVDRAKYNNDVQQWMLASAASARKEAPVKDPEVEVPEVKPPEVKPPEVK